VWSCNPNNPTGLPEPDGAIERLLEDIALDARTDGRAAPAVVVDEAYSEFTGRSLVPLRARFPNLVCVRTASKAYALAGLRVGFAVAARPTLERIALFRPPGSIGTISATAVARAMTETADMEANVARVHAERPRLAAALAGIGWEPQPSVTNFLLLDLATAQRSEVAALELMRRGLVPRTFGHGHPLAHCLRVTVRDAAENDRLVEAAREIAPTLPSPVAPAIPETAA
jgi:histidinol-phosphate aminotransferase